MTFTSPGSGGAKEGEVQDQAWADVLQNLVRILTGWPALRFAPFHYLDKHGERAHNTPRRWRTVLGLEEIQYLPEDIDDPDKRISLGRTAHEIWHVLFSRPELLFEHPDLLKNMAFQALWWAVEDPRVNTLGLERHPGGREPLDAAYARDYEVKDLEAERAYWTKSIPLHLQFNYALIYEWWKGSPDPRVTDSRVSAALERARDAIRRAVAAKSARKSFAIVKEEIWPIYKELLDEAYQDEQQKQDGESQDQQGQQGEGQEGEGKEGEGQESDSDSSSSQSSSSSGKPSKGKPGQGQPQKQKKPVSDEVKRQMEEAEKDFRDKHASKVADKPENLSESEREKAKKELEELRRKMGQKDGDSQQAQEGRDGQAGESGQGQDSKSSNPERQFEMTPEERQSQREKMSKPDEREEDLRDRDHDNYKSYYDRVKRHVPIMRQQFEQVLKRKIRRRQIANRDSGDLDTDRLHEIPSGQRDVFKEDMVANRSLYRISLLIDTSGSMSGDKRERAIEGAVMMMEALEKLPGVTYEIVVFDNRPRVVKAYAEKATRAVKAAVVRAIERGNGSTESHVAVREAVQRIRMGRGEKLVIMVNDGDPDYNFDREQYRAMIKSARDVEIHGVGLGPDAQLVKDLFPQGRGWWLSDAAEFAKNLRRILTQKLLGGR